MQIVIPGALPDTGTARELIPYLEKTAPALLKRFERSHAQHRQTNLLETACTCLEFWQLEQHGFKPTGSQTMSSGLGPLWHPAAPPDQAIWLAELVHVSPSRDGAGLLTAQQLQITPAQSLALFDAAKALFDAPGTELMATGTDRWQIRLPEAMVPASASPALVSATRVNDWWPQDPSTRPLRRLINELQMTWHEHPVNQDRQAQGLAPVNSLWVFGGAQRSQIVPPAVGHELWSDLQTPFNASDWSAWLQALAQIDEKIARLSPISPVILLGEDRIVTLTPPGLGSRLALYFSKRTHWRHWWSPRNS
ncbi:MAG: hypothetical protein GX086_04705 [Alcaligenaceae bacterium]|nr:hypothetical protein [Alcaligenaceae bacterium]